MGLRCFIRVSKLRWQSYVNVTMVSQLQFRNKMFAIWLRCFNRFYLNGHYRLKLLKGTISIQLQETICLLMTAVSARVLLERWLPIETIENNTSVLLQRCHFLGRGQHRYTLFIYRMQSYTSLSRTGCDRSRCVCFYFFLIATPAGLCKSSTCSWGGPQQSCRFHHIAENRIAKYSYTNALVSCIHC